MGCAAGGSANRRAAYWVRYGLAIGILCGSGASINECDHRKTDIGLRKTSSCATDWGAVPAKRANNPKGMSALATGGMKRAPPARHSAVAAKW